MAGVIVEAVNRGSQAASRVSPGWQVLSVNGIPVATVDDVSKALANASNRSERAVRVTFATYGALYVSEIDANLPENFTSTFTPSARVQTLCFAYQGATSSPTPATRPPSSRPRTPRRPLRQRPPLLRAGLPWS